MKGQSEIIVFILLFIIGVSLFLAAVLWSRGIFDRNADMAKLNAAESFMTRLDDKIQNVMKFGGRDSIDYNIDATIELIGIDKIEVRSPVTIEIPREWINISSDGSIIKEKLEGDLLRVQLYYPEDEYAVHLFTEGPRIATPQKVVIEKDSTYKDNNRLYVKIRLTFE